jgi:hypothetical protein
MLSTLDPILINTTQKSVESKQGICSSKPNAQQKLHAQKTFEIQKQFTNFFSSVTHSIHHKRASTGSSNFISCSTIISCLPCSFSPKYGTGTPKKHSAYEKRGYTAEACDARESGRLTCVDSICRARSLAIRTRVYKCEGCNAMRSWQQKVRYEVPTCSPDFLRSPTL